MLRKSLFILFLILSFATNAAEDYIKGEGRFYPQEGDRLGFIKKQLLIDAFRNVLSQEMGNMGLNSAFFWQKYDEKFDEYFEPIEEKLKEEMGINAESVSKKTKEAFNKKLRMRKLTLKGRFGRLNQAIVSYSIKKITRSAQANDTRYMNLIATVDRKVLNNIYFKFTKASEQRTFKNIFVTTNFVFEDGSWSDLGVEVAADFTGVVTEHWKKWLGENLSGYIDSVIITDNSMVEKLEKYINIPIEATQILHSDTSSGEDTDIRIVDDEYKDSLWLKVLVNIRKRSEDPLLKKREFTIDGQFLFMDLKNNKLLMYDDFENKKYKFSYEDSHALSSEIASLVYKLPMERLKLVSKELDNIPGKLNNTFLTIENLGSVVQLNEFIKQLSLRGITYQITPEIHSYTRTKGVIKVAYHGQPNDLISLLTKMNDMKLTQDKIISYTSEEKPFIVILRDMDNAESKDDPKNSKEPVSAI